MNALVSICKDPPDGGLGAIPWQFLCGILMAALGGFLVVKFKPEGSHGAPAGAKKPASELPAKAE